MRNFQKGFTLIEIMVVIAIVAILVTLAVSSYQNFIVRAKTAECITGAFVPQMAISEWHNKYRTALKEWPLKSDVGFRSDNLDFLSQFCSGFVYNQSNGSFHMRTDVSAVGLQIGRAHV